jgi:hypothetical protein
MPERIFMKPGMFIMALGPISIALEHKFCGQKNNMKIYVTGI